MSFSSHFAQSGEVRSSSLSTVFKISVAALATAASAVFIYKQRSFMRSLFEKTAIQQSPRLSKETLCKVTEELLLEFHSVMVEMSQMSVRVRQVLSLKGMSDQVSEEQLVEILMQQGLQEKMEEAQREVLLRHNLSEEEVAQAQIAYSGEPSVSLFASGIEDMFSAASQGELPILPGVNIPQELSPDLVISIFEEILLKKSDGYRRVLSESPIHPSMGSVPPPELAEKLQKESDKAEEEILKKFHVIIPHKAVFHSAAAIYEKDQGFANERKRQDRIHQAEIMKIMSRKETTNPQPLHKIASFSIKLQPSNEEVLPVLMMEAAEGSLSLVVAMVKPEASENMENVLYDFNEFVIDYTKDIETPGTERSTSSHTPTIAAVVPPTLIESGPKQVRSLPIFTYMIASKDSPLVLNERCKDCDVVYVVFARPEIQRKPVACLSLQELADVLLQAL